MKQRFLIPLMVLAVAALFAFGCKNEQNTTDTAATDTAISATDTSTTTSAMDTSGTGATGGTVSTLSDADKQFVMAAASGGMFEVSAGQLAAGKGVNQSVKDFGNRMVQDHGKANDELKQLATNKGLALPADMNDEQKKTMDDLQKKSGKNFDKAYMSTMVEDHEHDVADFQKESTAAQDPDLKNWVDKTLPVLQDHLKMAKETNAKVK